MILKGESAEEFNRKADENYEKYKARQKQNLIDMMEADEKLGLYQKPTNQETMSKAIPSSKLAEYAEILMQSENLGASVIILEQLLEEANQPEQETTQTVEKWEDFELYDVFETAIQESALTVVTKYHNLDEETAELALECVRIFKELKGATDKNKQDDNSTDNFNSNSVPSV